MKSRMKFCTKFQRAFNFIAVLSLLGLVTGAASSNEEAHAPVDESKSCILDETAVQDLQKSRERLDQRKADLDGREADLKEREKALQEQMQKLALLQEQVSKAQDEKKKESIEKINRLVETLLAMSPKSASKLLSQVSKPLAVAAMEQMDTQRLARIMNVMDTTRSSDLSEIMTGMVNSKRRSQGGATVKLPPQAKGQGAT